jgi:hypothetical protein
MKYFSAVVMFFLLFFSPENTFENIQIRVFNVGSKKISFLESKKIVIKSNDRTVYKYHSNDFNDSIEFVQDKIFFRGSQLKIIDIKCVVFNKKSYEISKCFYEKKRDFRGDCYLYVNEELGLIFGEQLFTGNIIEYEPRKYNQIHQEIMFNKMSFKKGSFEIDKSKTEYKKYQN